MEAEHTTCWLLLVWSLWRKTLHVRVLGRPFHVLNLSHKCLTTMTNSSMNPSKPTKPIKPNALLKSPLHLGHIKVSSPGLQAAEWLWLRWTSSCSCHLKANILIPSLFSIGAEVSLSKILNWRCNFGVRSVYLHPIRSPLWRQMNGWMWTCNIAKAVKQLHLLHQAMLEILSKMPEFILYVTSVTNKQIKGSWYKMSCLAGGGKANIMIVEWPKMTELSLPMHQTFYLGQAILSVRDLPWCFILQRYYE